MNHHRDLQIIRALESDSERLTTIAFIAKRHWKYPDDYYELWKDELTISSNYINKNLVFNATLHNLIIGFYSIVEVKSDFMAGEVLVKKGFWMEHIFILPEYHKKGIGRLIIQHALGKSKELGISSLKIFVDPNARGFYEKIGAKFIFDSKSSIPGRMIPVYELMIK